VPPEKVSVRVPASTANLGPGFDCLGIALDIYNQVTVEKSDRFSIAISGEGVEVLSRGQDNRVCQGIAAVYERIGQNAPDLAIHCDNQIPLSRGLGSSAAAVVGGLVAASLICGNPISPEEILQMAAFLEGHADNVAPALFGGCQVVVREDDHFLHAAAPLPPGIELVLFVPAFEMPTQQGRAILPIEVSREDAIYNLGRVSLLLVAFASGELQHLGVATRDRLHQPARQALFPAMGDILAAALRAGARGAFLSGAGSAIVALTTENSHAIGEAMRTAAEKAGIGGKARVARPSLAGALP